MKKGFPTIAMFLLGAAVFAGHAHASCGTSVRVSAADSECLQESHTSSTYRAYNYCLHQIKVKVDVKNASDKTRNISGGELATLCYNDLYGFETCDSTVSDVESATGIDPGFVTGSISTGWGRKINNVKCCSDYATCDRKSSDSYPD